MFNTHNRPVILTSLYLFGITGQGDTIRYPAAATASMDIPKVCYDLVLHPSCDRLSLGRSRTRSVLTTFLNLKSSTCTSTASLLVHHPSSFPCDQFPVCDTQVVLAAQVLAAQVLAAQTPPFGFLKHPSGQQAGHSAQSLARAMHS